MLGQGDAGAPEDEPGMDAFLQTLLQQFMTKDILYGPMKVRASVPQHVICYFV